jgi:hypothetical protein
MEVILLRNGTKYNKKCGLSPIEKGDAELANRRVWF